MESLGLERSLANRISLNSFNITGQENKFAKMKKLISAIQSFISTRAEDHVIVINQNLQALSLCLDTSIFDPHNTMAGQFFLSLYDLINILEPRSLTGWYCVDVLQNVCKNAAAREAIMHIYQFIPCLARMVNDQLTTEKKLQLLRLMEDLTCGHNMSWSITNLSQLLDTLNKWINRPEPEEIVVLSLGLLVNLCYMNSSSMCILQRTVDLKKFVRVCLALKGPLMEVYVCQVLTLVQNISSGSFPVVVFPKFIVSTLTAVLEAFKKKEIAVLKQVIQFYVSFLKNTSPKYDSKFDKYESYMTNILEALESAENHTATSQGVSIVFGFISFLIEKAKVTQLSCLYARIVRLALKWAQEPTVSPNALILLKNIALTVDKKNDDVLKLLTSGLNSFVIILNSGKNDGMLTNSEYIKRLESLLQLLTVLVQLKSISKAVLQQLHEDTFIYIFTPLLGEGVELNYSLNTLNICVYGLELVAKLSECDPNWKSLLNSLLDNKRTHMIIALVIFYCSADVKKTALGLSNACLDGVTSALVNITSFTKESFQHLQEAELRTHDVGGFVPFSQEERLNIILEKVESLIAKNELNNISASELMDLYMFKLSCVSQAEKAALANLMATNKHCTHLQHRMSQTIHENVQLHQSKVSQLLNLEKLDELAKQKEKITEKFVDLQNGFEAEKCRYKVLQSQLAAKEKELEECQTTVKDTENKLAKLQLLFNKVEESCRRHERNEKRQEELLKDANESIKNYNLRVSELEKDLEKKERLLEETKSILQYKSSILDSITKMANSQSVG